jgi:hypothetical protein
MMLTETGIEFFAKLKAIGVVAFDNTKKSNGFLGKYTSGRSLDGCLDGRITTEDLVEMEQGAIEKGYKVDTIVLPGPIWAYLLRDRSFGRYLYGFGYNLVPSNDLHVELETNLSYVLMVNSRDLNQVIVANSVKCVEKK